MKTTISGSLVEIKLDRLVGFNQLNILRITLTNNRWLDHFCDFVFRPNTSLLDVVAELTYNEKAMEGLEKEILVRSGDRF